MILVVMVVLLRTVLVISHFNNSCNDIYFLFYIYLDLSIKQLLLTIDTIVARAVVVCVMLTNVCAFNLYDSETRNNEPEEMLNFLNELARPYICRVTHRDICELNMGIVV